MISLPKKKYLVKMSHTLVKSALVSFCVFFVVNASVSVSVLVVYPQQQVPSGTSLSLRGSDPLSWDVNSVTLTNSATNTWSGSFVVTTVNASHPTWDMSVKIVAGSDNVQWELGCNHRLSLKYSKIHEEFTIYPYFSSSGKGATSVISNVVSPQLNNTRNVWIYRPPGWEDNPLTQYKRVLVMHDGQNLDPLWSVNSILDTLIAAGSIEQVFVIGPYNTPDRIAEYTYSVDPNYGGGKGDLYLNFIQDTLLSIVGNSFNIGQRSSLGILGSSLGGLISCYAGVTRPEVFDTVGCMSSSFWWNYGDFYKTVLPKITPLNGQSQRFYLDSGDSGNSDDDRPDTSHVATGFLGGSGGFVIGGNFFWYLDRGGQHNEFFWSARFHLPMQWLYFRDAVWNDGEAGASLKKEK